MKKRAQKVITFCLSFLISLVCVELLFRAYIPFSRTAQLLVSDNDWRQHPAEMKSLDELRINNPNFLLPKYSFQGFTTNSKGFLTPEHNQHKPENTFRIVYIGDSFGVGVVPYDQHFIRLLETELNEAQSKKKVEVINLSMPAIGVPTYERLLALEGMNYNPDIVIISFFVGNDFTDDYSDLKMEQRSTNLTDLSKTVTFFRKYNRLQKVRNSQAIAQPSSHAPGTFHPDEKPAYDPTFPSLSEEQYLEIVREKLVLFTDENAYLSLLPPLKKSFTQTTLLPTAKQTPTYLLVIPDEIQVNSELAQNVLAQNQVDHSSFVLDLPQTMLKEVVPQETLTIDLLASFLSQDNPSLLYQPNDSHINSYGNLLVKDVLFQALKDKVN